METNSTGRIVQLEWQSMVGRFKNILLRAFVIMPNHLHGIIDIQGTFVGATQPTTDQVSDGKDLLVEGLADDCGGSPTSVSHISQGRATRRLACGAMSIDNADLHKVRDSLDGSPLHKKRPNGPTSNSLGAMISQFKSRATKRIWKLIDSSKQPIWQRNYYEHIIRNEQEYHQIIQYIEMNPQRWQEDRLNPSAILHNIP